MPLLDERQLDDLYRSPPTLCLACDAVLRRNYCRQCDEFFSQGHVPTCRELLPEGQHVGHRVYVLPERDEDEEQLLYQLLKADQREGLAALRNTPTAARIAANAERRYEEPAQRDGRSVLRRPPANVPAAAKSEPPAPEGDAEPPCGDRAR